MATPKPIDLTQQRLQQLLHYDPATGVFTRLARTANRVHVGDVAGSLGSRGYTMIMVDLVNYSAHRLAWFYMTGGWPKEEIDHANGVRADNRFANLREVTRSENLQNQRKPRSDSSTGFLGVQPHLDGKFQARIMTDGRRRSLGLFPTAALAHEAYLYAKRREHRTCTI